MLRYFAIAGLLLLGACFTQKGTKKSGHSAIRYGMSRDSVLASIKDRSEIMVGEFNYPEGHLVAYQYSRFGKAGLKEPKYYLYFMNDTLIRKSEPEDLRRGARIAVRQYYYPEPVAPSKKHKRK